MAEKLIVEKRNQRRAFSAGGNIGRAEIGDGLDAGALGDDGAFADLQGACYLAAQKFHRLAFVKDGLAVRAD